MEKYIIERRWPTVGGHSLLLPIRPARRCCRGRYMFLLCVAILLLVCYGTVFFLPAMSGGLNKIDSHVRQHVQNIGENLLLPPVSDHGQKTAPHGDASVQRLRVTEDRERLYQRAQAATDEPAGALRPPEPELQTGFKSEIPQEPAAPPALASPVHNPVISGAEDPDPVMQFRRRKIKEMMQHAWGGYTRYAWGWNEVRPVSRQGHAAGSLFGGAQMGASIVDALDTLLIMDMREEFAEARQWVKTHLDFSQVSTDISVFETNIRYIGGLLSTFALTGDAIFKDKAEEIARLLLPAFKTASGLPRSLVVPATGRSHNYGWTAGSSSILSEMGTMHMEFAYLSDVTGNPVFRDHVRHVRQVLHGMHKPNGLYPFYINPHTADWAQLGHVSVGALGDSFYEYLLKEWLRSGQRDQEALDMYRDAIGNITDRLIKRSKKQGLTYVAELHNNRHTHAMDHLACFIGGLYALGGDRDHTDRSEYYAAIGAEITHTCYQSYNQTPTKLGPEKFWFTETVEGRAVRNQERYYILRPEVIESYFVLWRLTGDPKYREWGWEAAQAIEQFCRVEAGYSGIKNVDSTMVQHDDVQQSFFLAETLKYLYLLFSDKSLISLDEWVFNTEAHPLPIRGVNELYRQLT